MAPFPPPPIKVRILIWVGGHVKTSTQCRLQKLVYKYLNNRGVGVRGGETGSIPTYSHFVILVRG